MFSCYIASMVRLFPPAVSQKFWNPVFALLTLHVCMIMQKFQILKYFTIIVQSETLENLIFKVKIWPIFSSQMATS